MSEQLEQGGAHEEPIHQAPWVFPTTVLACYGFLVIVMGAKWAAFAVDKKAALTPHTVNGAKFFTVFGVQAIIFIGFLLLFGGLVYLVNKLVGATSAAE